MQQRVALLVWVLAHVDKGSMSKKSKESARPPKRQPRPEVSPRDPTKTYKHGISQKQQRLVGEVIYLWSHLEQVLEELIWTILNVDVSVGRVVTARLDANHKFELLRGLSNALFDEGRHDAVATLLGRLQDEYDARNVCAHGRWVTIEPGNVPAALSLRDKLPPTAEKDEVVAYYFTEEVMTQISHNIKMCTNLIITLKNEILEERGLSPAQDD